MKDPFSKKNIFIHPPIVERSGKKLAVIAFSDIDGTINNESLPERDRLGSIAPAKEGIIALEDKEIPVGLITARSFGEAEVYQNALNNQGFTICEDGAVIILPHAAVTDENKQELAKRMRLIEHNEALAVLLSRVDTFTIERFLSFILTEASKQNSHQELLSTCTSSPEALLKDVYYDTLDDAKRSMDRIGSAYVRNTSEIQRAIIHKFAPSWNIRVFGDPHHLHLIGEDANKGNALQFINDNIQLFLPHVPSVDGILPVVFGNNINDLALFRKAYDMSGISVLVKNAQDGYSVPEDEIGSSTLKAKRPFGHGILEAVPYILHSLKLA